MKGFESETDRARQIVQQRPDYWQFQLASELLKTKLQEVTQRHETFNQPHKAKNKKMGVLDYVDETKERLSNFKQILERLKKGVVGVSFQVGTPLEIDDPLEIKRAVDSLISNCEEMLDWENELDSIDPPDSFQKFQQLLHEVVGSVFASLNDIPDEILKPIEPPVKGGVYEKVFPVDTSKLDEALKELERLLSDPNVLKA